MHHLSKFEKEFKKYDFFEPEFSPYYLAIVLTKAIYIEQKSDIKVHSNIFSLSIIKKQDFSDSDIIHTGSARSDVLDEVQGYLMRHYIGYLSNPGSQPLYEYISNTLNKHKTI